MMWLFKGVGALLALIGMVLTAFPGLLFPIQEQPDRFLAIEQRTRFGALSGLGIGLSFVESAQPFARALAYMGFWVTAGFLVARGVGNLVDGAHPKQLRWLGVETLVCLLLAYKLWGGG